MPKPPAAPAAFKSLLGDLQRALQNLFVQRSQAQGPDWAALHAEATALLDRWYGELATHGEIEDEDADPVGVGAALH